MKTTIPTELHMSISSITDAVNYWLNNVVFKENIEIENIRFTKEFTNEEHFIIKFKREENE